MRTSSVPPALIGRESDLSALRRALDDAVPGVTRTVLVGGEAGIGKSRLVAEFLASLPNEALVLRGQSIDLDRDAPPYAPISMALRELAAVSGAEALLASAGAAAGGLGVLVPELALRPGTAPGLDVSARAGTAFVFDAVTAVLEAASLGSAGAPAGDASAGAGDARPVVLVVEDLHWADQASLSLLRFLVRVSIRGRLLLVLTFRSEELRRGHPLRSWLPELERSDRVERRELARLTRQQVRAMVTSMRGAKPDPHDLAVLVERSDGVPFFIEEIACSDSFASRDTVPDSLRDILLARYEGLGDGAQKFVRMLSAGGTCVEHGLIEAVYPGEPDDIDLAARDAIAAGVLEVDGTRYTFRHALVRDAIHDQLLPGERVRYHTAYARALESGACGPGSSGGAGQQSAEISYHFVAAHDSRNAFLSSLAAMEQAGASFAYADAARMGERALEFWDEVDGAAELAGRDRAALIGETAHHLRNAGESERAIALVDEAIDLLERAVAQEAGATGVSSATGSAGGADASARAGAPAHALATLLRDKASYLANIGLLGSIGHLRRALEVLDGEGPSVLRANILGELSARLMLEARYDEAVDTADRAYAEAESAGSAARMSVAANIRGVSLLHSGETERGLAQLEHAHELAGGNDSANLRYWINYSDALLLLGRFDEAIAAAERGAERARLRGVERTTGAMLMANTVDPLYATGEWARADTLLDRALELDSPIGFAAHLQRRKLWATLWSGDVPGAVRLLREWRAPLSRHLRTDVQSRLGLARIAGEIALEDGRITDAWAEARVVLEPDHRPVPGDDLPLLVVAARIAGAARRAAVELTLPAAAESETLGAGAAGARAPGAEAPASYAEIVERMRGVAAQSAAWPTAPVYLALVDAELGHASPAADDPTDEPALWRRALEAAAAPTSPAYLAPYARLRLAEALASRGGRDDRAAARVELSEARDAAVRVGAELVAEHADRLERRWGATTAGEDGATDQGERGAEAGGPASVAAIALATLTERERQVLDLVARGSSNRQIADELFISVKTASVHVSNILRKLGAASRTEAAYLARSA